MSPKDRVAFVIAAGLVSWGVFAIAATAWRNKNFTESGSEVLALIAGTLGASLAAYFALRNGGK